MPNKFEQGQAHSCERTLYISYTTLHIVSAQTSKQYIDENSLTNGSMIASKTSNVYEPTRTRTGCPDGQGERRPEDTATAAIVQMLSVGDAIDRPG